MKVKRWLPALLVLILLVGCLAFTGCHGEKEEYKKLEDLQFTVVGEKDVPPPRRFG